MALKARTILAEPGQLLAIFSPLLMLYLFNFTLSTLAGKHFFCRGNGIALVYGTVMRNLSIALAIAINAFGEAGTDAALVIALAYIVQVQSAAWYVRLTDSLFGRLPAAGQA
jgi:ACR3 family arsenite efflux pump ArsB